MTTGLPKHDNVLIQKQYYSVKETASILGVDLKTVYRAIAAGELPALRIRNTLRVPHSVVFPVGDVPHTAGCAGAPSGATLRAGGRVLARRED